MGLLNNKIETVYSFHNNKDDLYSHTRLSNYSTNIYHVQVNLFCVCFFPEIPVMYALSPAW